jgi:hypothetical protein
MAHINTILPSMPISSKWCLVFTSSDQTSARISSLSMHATWPFAWWTHIMKRLICATVSGLSLFPTPFSNTLTDNCHLRCDAVYYGRNISMFPRNMSIRQSGVTIPNLIIFMFVAVSTWNLTLNLYLSRITRYLVSHPEQNNHRCTRNCIMYISIYVVQSLSSWTVVLSHHISRYSHTRTQIHIDPQNSCRWLLCKSANVDIAAENTAETYWQEIPFPSNSLPIHHLSYHSMLRCSDNDTVVK